VRAAYLDALIKLEQVDIESAMRNGQFVREVFSSEAEMMSYELAYNAVAHRFPAVTLCQYDVRAFNGEVILEALKAHPDTYEQRVATFLS
jgi:hypothetical protein